MKLNLGTKIKELRKRANCTQEEFAKALGVTSQAVSRWESGGSYPDMELIPAIASFFGVTTDELFDFQLYETKRSIDAIVDEYSKLFYTDRKTAESVIRDGLKKHPGNDVLLNCLICVLDINKQNDEIISTAKTLVTSTKCDEIRFDAYRIMAYAYKAKGEYQAAKDAIEHIPEIYFSKLQVAAELLEGEDKYEAAQKQKNLSAETLIDMLIIISKYFDENGETEKAKSQLSIAKKVVNAFSEDFLEEKYFKYTLFETELEKLNGKE